MLNRLADLKKPPLRPVETADKEDGDAAGQDGDDRDEDEEEEEAELDEEEKDFMEDMRERFQEMLEDEGAAKQAFTEVRNRVDNMQKFVKEEQAALLPSKITTLHNKFESEEIVCQRMIRRAKDTLATLKAEDEDYEPDDVAAHALWPVRQSLAQARQKEFKLLVQGFFNARSHSQEEMLQRTYRQLKFAYPDALEHELRDILEFPEVAIDAINQRLEKGVEANSLEHILEDLEGRKGDARKLEQGAKELKLMFLQFSELIDTQGESLNAIEANIQVVIEQTDEAIGVLQDAEQAKRAYQGNVLKSSCCCMFLFAIFIAHPLWQYVNGEGEAGQADSWYDAVAGESSVMFGGLAYLKSFSLKDFYQEHFKSSIKKDKKAADKDEHGKNKSGSLFQVGVWSTSALRNQDSIAKTAAVTLGLDAFKSQARRHAAPSLARAPPTAKDAVQMLQGPLRRLVAMSSRGNMDGRQRSALRRRANHTSNTSAINWRTTDK
mmetsp:Transcript_17407/g.32820  ORF Transcript_17407/g.32820 Transcript_17407/m.32820 type:complete len:493 (+) Transcript_17407:66-1544(+)